MAEGQGEIRLAVGHDFQQRLDQVPVAAVPGHRALGEDLRELGAQQGRREVVLLL